MKKNTKKDDGFGHGVKPLILLFLLISGTCGLVYEILWMKMLTLVIGNTVFSITTVLTAFMGGLALGSFLAGRFIDKIRDPLRMEVRTRIRASYLVAVFLFSFSNLTLSPTMDFNISGDKLWRIH